MRIRLTLLCILGCGLSWVRATASAPAPATSKQICAPPMLDVSALPSPPTFAYGGHIFVLEIQNISPAACSLQSPEVVLEPPSDTNNQPYYAAWRASDPGYKTESQPQVLEPGAWAHLLFAWTSRAGPELSCDQYSGMRLRFTLHPQWEREDEAFIEVRHLWIRACGLVGVTGYRMGKYDGSPVPQSWMDWYGPDGLHGLTLAAPVISAKITRDSSLLLLSAQAKRTMLGDRGFALKLNFPRLAADGCAFSQLRKRESDGTTVISIQQCDDVVPDKTGPPPAVPWYHEPGVMGLYMGNLDFTPKHFGSLEYDVTAPVGRNTGQNAAIQYARTRVELVARDPTLPQQVAILDPLQACSSTQVHVVSLPPVISTPLRTLRAYNATNISQQACSLAGVPRTRGLDDKGAYQHAMPPACPNCDNDLFAARPNGRIDLKPGETAHLLVGTTGSSKYYCSTPKIELSFDREASQSEPLNTRPLPADIAQSATVPFEASDCVSTDISAWRQGPFDGDPLNLRRARLIQAGGPAPEAPIPAECDKPELLAHGRPRMIEGTHNPEYGLSMVKREFVRDESIPFYLWTNNSTNEDLDLGTRAQPAFFKGGDFVLYDAYSHRVLSKSQLALDKQCKANPSGIFPLPECTVCIQSPPFPAHTCRNNSVDLATAYELPPGEYFLSTRDPGDVGSCPHESNKPFQPNPSTDISFEVLQP